MVKQIGWYNLKEDKVFCNNGYECAAWYENILVRAGKYPVEVVDYKILNDGQITGHIGSAYITMNGTIESDDFGSRFCGVPIGDYDCYKNKGQKSNYIQSAYLFSVSDSILNNPKTCYELFHEYEARRIDFEYNGEMHHTHGIFLKENI